MIHRLFSRLPRSLVLGLVPGLLVVAASGAHPAYAVDTVVVDIVNENGKCLSEENAAVVIDTCDGTQRQDWKLVHVPVNPDDVLIRNDLTGNCLEPHDLNRGAQVIPVGCEFSGGNRNQLWIGIGLSGGDLIEIANEGDGRLVMHPSGCGATDDLPVFMNVPNQCNADFWKFPFPSS